MRICGETPQVKAFSATGTWTSTSILINNHQFVNLSLWICFLATRSWVFWYSKTLYLRSSFWPFWKARQHFPLLCDILKADTLINTSTGSKLIGKIMVRLGPSPYPHVSVCEDKKKQTGLFIFSFLDFSCLFFWAEFLFVCFYLCHLLCVFPASWPLTLPRMSHCAGKCRSKHPQLRPPSLTPPSTCVSIPLCIFHTVGPELKQDDSFHRAHCLFFFSFSYFLFFPHAPVHSALRSVSFRPPLHGGAGTRSPRVSVCGAQQLWVFFFLLLRASVSPTSFSWLMIIPGNISPQNQFYFRVESSESSESSVKAKCSSSTRSKYEALNVPKCYVISRSTMIMHTFKDRTRILQNGRRRGLREMSAVTYFRRCLQGLWNIHLKCEGLQVFLTDSPCPFVSDWSRCFLCWPLSHWPSLSLN